MIMLTILIQLYVSAHDITTVLVIMLMMIVSTRGAGLR